MSKQQGQRQNVAVVCRVRPTNQKEISSGGITCVKHNDTNIEVNADGGQNSFNFDRVFGPESTQIQVFESTARPLINDVLAGYNATIFAYGQTGTGKTHTMEGDITSDTGKGIIPRAVEALFNGVEEADENIEFTFKVTYVEIYLERIRDLMDENRLKNNLAIREDKLKGIYIAGVTEVYVGSAEELLQIMHVGATNRATAATGMNEGSSRSHSVFTITVGQRDVTTNAAKSGKLVLVDLAGSEMVRKTNASGQQLEEAKTINKSLSALGQVIYALTDDKQSHVPYRDSKLTRVLQDSLGGNSKTVLIIAVSPSSFNASETLSTLRFGTRAKSIENKVTINQTRSVEELEALLVKAEKAIDAQAMHIIAITSQLQQLQQQIQQAPPPAPATTPTTKSQEKSEKQPKQQQQQQPQPPAPPQLEEGKVIVDLKKLQSDAETIKRLQQTILALTQELEDEKQDSMRKDSELTEMGALLKEKERLIQDAATMLDEVKKNNDGLRERSEQLLHEKIEAIGELQSVKASKEDEVGKVRFEMMELEVRLQTVVEENKQLKSEIAELGGGDGENESSNSNSNNKNNNIGSKNNDERSAGNNSTSSKVGGSVAAAHAEVEQNQQPSITSPKTPNRQNLISSAATNEDEETIVATNNNESNVNNLNNINGSSKNNNASNLLNRRASGGRFSLDETNSNFGKALSATESKALLEKFSEEFAAVCLKHAIDEETSAELFAILDAYAEAQEQSVTALEEKGTNFEKTASKRIRDLEEQRTRLEKDLQNRIENMVQLQMKFDSLSRVDGRQSNDLVNEREQARSSSLQQRLEQLVAVHRQLLRKFATLELEANELKKKTQLRDERIRMLEGNARSLIGSIRSQAEKHVAELAILRENIQVVKGEFDHRAEEMKQQQQLEQNTTQTRGNIKVVVRPTKAVRGGGGVSNLKYSASNTSQDSDDLSPGVTSPTNGAGEGGHGNSGSNSMFSRFLGSQKK